MAPTSNGGWAESFKITENGRVVSYLVATIHQTTNIEDLDPAFKVKTWMK